MFQALAPLALLPKAAVEMERYSSYGEFDPGSERTLAAWIRHASRTGL